LKSLVVGFISCHSSDLIDLIIVFLSCNFGLDLLGLGGGSFFLVFFFVFFFIILAFCAVLLLFGDVCSLSWSSCLPLLYGRCCILDMC